jgi:hypothetical protein
MGMRDEIWHVIGHGATALWRVGMREDVAHASEQGEMALRRAGHAR